MKYILLGVCLISNVLSGQQKIYNDTYFSEFFAGEENEKKLLLLGENHSSSVAPTVYPELVKMLYEKNQVDKLLVEFGPAEAYFYNLYLETGNKKHLAYTIYGGYYTDWQEAWEEIYQFNKTLKVPLEVIGVDFDRTRTFAYALYNILKTQEHRPTQIDSLMNVIAQPQFYKAYGVGYPTEKGKKFVREAKEILAQHQNFIKDSLPKKDSEVILELMNNHAVGFGGSREEDIGKNVINYVKTSDEKNFLLLVGRDHTYLEPLFDKEMPRLANILKREKSLSILTGLVLHEESQQWDENFKTPITLYELRDKHPWKEFYEPIDKRAKGDFTIVPLTGTLKSLSKYVDYILIAKNQGPIQF
ncbi:hypothetical protein [Sinomicrobium sp.]